MSKILPIRPSEIGQIKLDRFPDEVIKAVNEMIALNWDGDQAMFRQEDLVAKILENYGEANIEQNRKKIYENNWLKFGDIYRKEGWNIDYDRPGYNESYPATYTFSKKKKKNDDD